MDRARKQRNGFRPSLNDASLEERTVMASGSVGVASLMGGAAQLRPMAAQVHAQANTQTVTARDIAQTRAAYAAAFRNAFNTFRFYTTAQINQLYANGRPTAQQFNDFKSNLAGSLNALALNLSSQYMLLPGSSSQLASNLQTALLGNGRNSLASQINNLNFGAANTSSARSLQNFFNNTTNSSFNQNGLGLNNFFNTTAFNRLSVDQNGNRIPLAQFQTNQLLNQFGNSLGLIANNFSSNTPSNSVLFPNGMTDAQGNPIAPNSAALGQFASQYRNALSTAAFQLNNGLAAIPGSSNFGGTLTNTLQNSLFGNGTAATPGLFGSLGNLPFGQPNFSTAANNAFNTSFNNLAGNLSDMFGVVARPANGFTLPTNNFTNPFGSNFAGNTFNAGFNNGFSTNGNAGFFGFGTAPNTFNTNFGTGFNNFTAAGLTNSGFTLPNFTGLSATPGFGSGAGFGGGTGGGLGGSTGGLGGGTGLPGFGGSTGFA